MEMDYISIGNFFTYNPTGILNYDPEKHIYKSIGKNSVINTTKGAAELELQKTLENKVSCANNKVIVKENFNNNNKNNNNNLFILFLFLFLFLFIFLKKYLHII